MRPPGHPKEAGVCNALFKGLKEGTQGLFKVYIGVR